MSEDTHAVTTAPEVVVEPAAPAVDAPTPEQIAAAQKAEAEADAAKPMLQVVQVMRQNLANTKAFSLAKADSVVTRITSVGGEVPASLQAELDALRAEAK